MTPLEIADTCARAIADPGAVHDVPSVKAPSFFAGCQAPDGQVCAAVWLPWDWADLPDQELFFAYLRPACLALTARVPAGDEPSPQALIVPEGVASAMARYADVTVRAIVMDHPVPTKELSQDFGVQVRPWFNAETDSMERRPVVPLLRLDMLIKPKELAS